MRPGSPGFHPAHAPVELPAPNTPEPHPPQPLTASFIPTDCLIHTLKDTPIDTYTPAILEFDHEAPSPQLTLLDTPGPLRHLDCPVHANVRSMVDQYTAQKMVMRSYCLLHGTTTNTRVVSLCVKH